MNKVKCTIKTSDIDEAIVKVKILNNELEKAKSSINELACPCKLKINDSTKNVDIKLSFDNMNEIDVKKMTVDIKSKVRSLQEHNLGQ